MDYKCPRYYEWENFKLVSNLGKGSFGEIYLGLFDDNDFSRQFEEEEGKELAFHNKSKDISTTNSNETKKILMKGRRRKRKVAVKFEHRKNKKKHWLLKEIKYIKRISRHNIQNTPRIIWSGIENGFNVMAMKLHSESLLDLKCKYKKFSLKTCLMIGIKLITIIEQIHNLGIIHCDIKPSNLLLDLKDNKEITLIDFGLAKDFMVPKNPKKRKEKSSKDKKKQTKHLQTFEENEKNKKNKKNNKKNQENNRNRTNKEIGDMEFVHYQQKWKKKNNNSITGTALFCSLNCHKSNLSRRDDLESIGLLIIYFLKGKLPWQNISRKNKYEKYRIIYQRKRDLKFSFLEDLDDEFLQYFKYVRKLKFDEKPDYEYLRNLFHYLMIKRKLKNDSKYDWVIRPNIFDVSESEEDNKNEDDDSVDDSVDDDDANNEDDDDSHDSIDELFNNLKGNSKSSKRKKGKNSPRTMYYKPKKKSAPSRLLKWFFG